MGSKVYKGFVFTLIDEDSMRTHTIEDLPLTREEIIKRITEILNQEEEADERDHDDTHQGQGH